MERRQWLLGMLATVAVLIIWWGGYLEPIEQQFFNFRMRWCWQFSDPPSDRLVVVALDDPTINTVGRWPWPRERLGVIIDELRRAGAASVALDLLLDDPAEPRRVPVLDPSTWEWNPNPTPPATPPNADGADAPPPGRIVPTEEVDGDDEFARAIFDYGQVVLATSFKFGDVSIAQEPAAGSTTFSIRLADMIALVEKEREKLLDSSEEDVKEELPRLVQVFAGASYSSGAEFQEVRRKLGSARILLKKAEKYSIPLPPQGHNWARSVEPSAVLERLAYAAAIGNVTFDSYDSDGTTRRVPLWVEHNNRLWPTLGLAAVLTYWGVDASVLSIEGDQTLIKLPGSPPRRIPMMRSLVRKRVVDGLVYVPWPRGTLGKDKALANAAAQAATPVAPTGAGQPLAEPSAGAAVSNLADWQFQFFDLSRNEESSVRAGRVYEPQLQRERIIENIVFISKCVEESLVRQDRLTGPRLARFRAAVRTLLTDRDDVLSPGWSAKLAEFFQTVADARADGEGIIRENADILCPKLFEPVKDDEAAVEALKVKVLTGDIPRLAEEHGYFEGIENPEELAALKQELVKIADLQNTVKVIDAATRLIDTAGKSIRDIRADLSRRIKGKIVFFGWTATGQAADFVATSVDPKTPGVMVHVAIADAVLRGSWRTAWPLWLDVIVIVILGLGGTWTAVRSSVVVAPLTIGIIVITWFALAGVVLWDINHLVASLAGPWVAASAGWLTVLLHRLLVEQRDRKVTEERFKSYVSPAVVDILVNNPELAMMKPSMREMTVMFSDLADFTTTSERLGPVLLAKCLSKYLKEMTEILQKNKGTLDKYLGDGIMCFWNAPLEDAEHARHACQTAVQMVKRLEELNDVGGFEEAGRLKVRIGLCTGQCMVGDFGNPPRNSNYTLLGDTANFAARLESANKFFGSKILATQRVRDQAGPDVRWRTIGRVFVKGKKEADMLYELIGPLAPHGPATEEWIEASNAAVEDYAASRFDQCLRKFDMLARRFGDTKLAEIYADAIETWKARPDFPAAFDGSIVLTEK